MEDHQWFLQLRRAMREQRVPIMYANRLIEELWLHYLEMKERDEMKGLFGTDSNLSERLGSPDTLAVQASSFRRRTWVGRHPWLTFLFGSQLVAFGLILLSVLMSAFVLLPLIKGRTTQSDPWLEPAMLALGHLQVIVPAFLVA